VTRPRCWRWPSRSAPPGRGAAHSTSRGSPSSRRDCPAARPRRTRMRRRRRSVPATSSTCPSRRPGSRQCGAADSLRPGCSGSSSGSSSSTATRVTRCSSPTGSTGARLTGFDPSALPQSRQRSPTVASTTRRPRPCVRSRRARQRYSPAARAPARRGRSQPCSGPCASTTAARHASPSRPRRARPPPG